MVSSFSGRTHRGSITTLRAAYSRFTSWRCWCIRPIVVKCTGSDITDFYLEPLVLSDSSVVAWGYDIWEFRGKGEGCGSGLVSSGECNAVSLGVAVILRSGGVPLEVRDVLMSWTIVASSLLESGGGVESKTMARRVGW